MYPLKAEMGLPFMCQSQYEMFPKRQLKLTLYWKLLTFFLFCMGEIKFIFQLKKKKKQPLFGFVVFCISEMKSLKCSPHQANPHQCAHLDALQCLLAGRPKSDSCGIFKQKISKCFPPHCAVSHILCSPYSVLCLFCTFDFFTSVFCNIK